MEVWLVFGLGCVLGGLTCLPWIWCCSRLISALTRSREAAPQTEYLPFVFKTDKEEANIEQAVTELENDRQLRFKENGELDFLSASQEVENIEMERQRDNVDGLGRT